VKVGLTVSLTAAAPNAGVVGMCKEHLGVALALKIPVFFLVTKVQRTATQCAHV
jgi:GTPase